MQEILQYAFGPLEENYYCTFFLVLTIFGFVFMCGATITLIYSVIQRTNSVIFWNNVLIVIFYAVFYLQSRIMYSLCLGSLGKNAA